MPINPDLLIAAPMLQDYLVDKVTGAPLVNGIVTLWVDTQRYVDYKNWYYQTGSPGAYTFIPLDNPLTLSSVGTIQDPNGNDVIPFYYPFDETNENLPQAYFITVYSSDENGDPDLLQFTRENFPYMPSNVSPTASNPTWRNYILNNVYWRNCGNRDLMDITNEIIAGSQHDGYSKDYTDIRFIKNVTGADDDIAFTAMTETLDNDITPEYYLNFTCDSVQVGETTKCIQYPVCLHVNSLKNVSATLVMQAQNVSGNPNNYLDIYIYQFVGTGALSQPDPIFVQRITLNSDFQKFLIPLIFPDTAGLTLGEGGDDALFIRVQYPLSAVFQINHTKPQLYLSDDVPDNDFDAYDQIEAIINSPRTGDYRTSLNSFVPFGWVAANDGSIGSSASSATCRANIDTWPLYDLLWNSILNAWCPVSTGRGASAYADFTANKRLTLTRNLGRVLAGLQPMTSTTGVPKTSVTFTADAGTDILTLTTATSLTVGTPVQVANTGGALPTPLAASTVYFVSTTSLTTTTIKLSTTLENAYAGTDIDITVAGSGTQTLYSALGAYVGETNHTLTIAEMPAHNHPGSNAPVVDTAGGAADAARQAGAGATGTITVTVASQGSGTAHNTMQPTFYGNVFIKL